MSLESTLEEGANFRIWTRAPEDRVVFVELTGVPFTATPRGVTLEIPAETWEKLRSIGIDHFRVNWWGPEDGQPDPEDEAWWAQLEAMLKSRPAPGPPPDSA